MSVSWIIELLSAVESGSQFSYGAVEYLATQATKLSKLLTDAKSLLDVGIILESTGFSDEFVNEITLTIMNNYRRTTRKLLPDSIDDVNSSLEIIIHHLIVESLMVTDTRFWKVVNRNTVVEAIEKSKFLRVLQ